MRRSCRAPDSPWPWLTRITRNEAYRLLSRHATTREIPTERMPDEAVAPDDDAVVARVDVERALAGLSSADRLILRLRYEADLTHPAVADALGMSVVGVKVRVHRLRPKLKEILQNP